MKTIPAIVLVLGLSGGAALCQEAQVDPVAQELLVQESLSERAASDSVEFQAKMVQQVFGVKVEWDGAAAKALRMENPLQLFNPFAPARYGSGFDNVTQDPNSGDATGVKILGIGF